MRIETIHESPELIAVDKPPGLTVIPARNEPLDQCLHRLLEQQRNEKLWVVHRLDRDTSGVLVFARTAEAHRQLSLAFEGRTIRKRYLALTCGVALPTEGRIDTPLHPARKGKMRPALPGESGAQSAWTEYTVLRRWPHGPQQIALVEVRPRTGRQHQIRVHLRSVEAPLLIDPLYAPRRPDFPEGRLTLHSHRLDWGDLHLEAPIPADLQALIEGLGPSRSP